ncbi:hypothetical protein RON43_06020 [Lactobacillus gasseri]|uniref:hypothetical protein n=1 Tax=Lactobacillus gasseri TaxID=1596 RepID=UPI00254BBC18|nr:hypothetical protein [Lactobacillus gasseri]MDK6501238.1 hypothetical protein [Lactobacillus gasseri]MDT9590642.1 hypothetical protein [Lactobacillus gasseri]MDT9611887.1 hypothetical protein [Lactobacillus gasseri]
MKTALDVQREMNNYQPRYQKKTIRQKLEQAISSREYEKFSEKYLDRVITHSIVRNQTARSYEGKEYPFVILEKWIKYDDFLIRLVLIAYLDNKEREIFLNSKKLFADIVCKVKHKVKVAMKKRGFKYQRSKNLYLDPQNKPYGDIFSCFVIKNKFDKKLFLELSFTTIFGIVSCLYLSEFNLRNFFGQLRLLFLGIILLIEYSISDDLFITKVHKQQQEIFLSEEEKKKREKLNDDV